MADYTVKFVGLNELRKDFEKVLDIYPDETAKALRSTGKAFIKDTTAMMPAYYSTGKRALNNAKEWTCKDINSDFSGHTLGVGITCTAPHWHLVENGHWLWVNGHFTGQFAHGKHYVEKQGKIYNNTLPTLMAGYVDHMLRKANL